MRKERENSSYNHNKMENKNWFEIEQKLIRKTIRWITN